MNTSRKLALLALLLAAAAPVQASPPKSAACATPASRLAGLGVTADDPAAADRSLHWVATVPADSHSLVETRLVSGLCASLVWANQMSLVGLSSGETFSLDQAGRIVPPLGDASLLAPATIAGPAPILAGARFVSATEVDAKRIGDDLRLDYLGLWHDGEGSIVASFSRLGDRPAGPVRPIFRSDLPLSSLLYFPAPDTPSGRVALTQHLNDGSVRLIGLSWYHPKWFEAN
jgi:hypothetical protein